MTLFFFVVGCLCVCFACLFLCLFAGVLACMFTYGCVCTFTHTGCWVYTLYTHKNADVLVHIYVCIYVFYTHIEEDSEKHVFLRRVCACVDMYCMMYAHGCLFWARPRIATCIEGSQLRLQSAAAGNDALRCFADRRPRPWLQLLLPVL